MGTMSFLVVFLIIIAALFATAFFTKRRFGVLGLALAAGAMLSTLWVGDLTPIIASAGFVLIKPPLESVVAAALILFPATILLVSGPTYSTMSQRVVGASVFAILATALLLQPMGSALVIDGVGKTIYDLFVEYRSVIISICLMLAVFDLLIAKTPKAPKHH